ncbi:MAG: sulfatase-like hydrolase/transferase [Spirochaetales bacterium]|nr:sulfatase-like hydrolase/transferase [Spirochaetales bacterium]
MSHDLTPMPRILRNAGYKTYMSSFTHESTDPVWEGYDEVNGAKDEDKPAYAERVFSRHVGSGVPFLLSINTQAVHRPFMDEYDKELADTMPIPHWMPDDPCTRVDIACFHRYIADSDAKVGQILSDLERRGLVDNTLVIFTTDHGMPFARAKHTLFDPGLKIAFVARWPGLIQGGQVSGELLSNLDFMPTLLDLVGLRDKMPPMQNHGSSFAGLLVDREHEQYAEWSPREEIFAEHTYGVMYSPSRGIRTDRYKYIVNFEPRNPIMHEPFVVHRCGEEKVNEWFSAPVPPEELYDLLEDPTEFMNLANSPCHGAIRRELRNRLFAFMESSDDILLEGPVPDPSGDHTQGQTIPGEWRVDDRGLYHSDLPPVWQRDKFKSRS